MIIYAYHLIIKVILLHHISSDESLLQYLAKTDFLQ